MFVKSDSQIPSHVFEWPGGRSVNKNQKYTNKHNGDGNAYQFPPPPIETVTARDPAGPPSPDGPAAHIAHAIYFHSPI